jgi:hypothetical protein
MYAYAVDFADEGVETVLANIHERAGLDGVGYSITYHDARDLFPHNPKRKTGFMWGGQLYFQADKRLYNGLRLQPLVNELVTERDLLTEVKEAVTKRGMDLNAWTLFLHDSPRWAQFPDLAPRNAYGDLYLTELCPANPEVRAYAHALAMDIARYRPATVISESLHFLPFEYGLQQERGALDLTPRVRLLLSLCFCPHCREAAIAIGVDADSVARAVREELDGVLSGNAQSDRAEVDRLEIGKMCSGEMRGYLEARCNTVTSLMTDVATTLRAEDVELVVLEIVGAMKGYATGAPAGASAASQAWQLGVEPTHLAKANVQVEPLGYARIPSRIEFELAAFRESLPDARLGLGLRPALPDTDSVDNLAQKLVLATRYHIDRLDYYHYGFVPLSALDLIREASTAVR